MTNPIKVLVQDYEWVHLSLGLGGNVLFFAGSVLFLPRVAGVHRPDWLAMEWQTLGVWFFVEGRS